MEVPGAVNVVVGPFPVRWARIGFGLLWLVVIGFAASMKLETTSLVCRRDVGQAAGCNIRWSAPLPRAKRFPPGAVAAVEVYKHAGLKGTSPPSYVVTLLDWRGRETGVESYSTEHDAEGERDALRAFFADGTRLELTREIRPRPATYVMFGAVLLVGLLIILNGLSSGGRLRIALDEARRTVRVRRTILGVPVNRSIKHAAAEINAPLALEAPQLANASPVVNAPPAGNVVSRWASGASTLRLFGWVALVAALGFGGVYWFADETQGWLELEAESRCELGGATLLPGGSMSMALDPGSYTIRVFNPNVPGGWETQKFEIKLHGTTRVHCRPTKR
jgi:hypothetical protein